jgi:CHAD domain-containing protein
MSGKDPSLATAHAAVIVANAWDEAHRSVPGCRNKASRKKVHDLRSCLRKLSVLLDLLDSLDPEGPFSKALKTIRREFRGSGKLRDAQVQLQLGKALFKGSKDVLHRLKLREHKLRKAFEAQLNDKTLIRCMSAVAERIGALSRKPSFGSLLHDRLDAAIESAFEQAVIEQPRSEEEFPRLHPARIAFKKYRSLAETLGSAVLSLNSEVVAAVREHQSLMGDLHDIDLLALRLDKWKSKLGRPESARLSKAVELRKRKLSASYFRSIKRLERADKKARP